MNRMKVDEVRWFSRREEGRLAEGERDAQEYLKASWWLTHCGHRERKKVSQENQFESSWWPPNALAGDTPKWEVFSCAQAPSWKEETSQNHYPERKFYEKSAWSQSWSRKMETQHYEENQNYSNKSNNYEKANRSRKMETQNYEENQDYSNMSNNYAKMGWTQKWNHKKGTQPYEENKKYNQKSHFYVSAAWSPSRSWRWRPIGGEVNDNNSDYQKDDSTRRPREVILVFGCGGPSVAMRNLGACRPRRT